MSRTVALERGRFKRDPDRWQTEFGRWVADFGVPRIVAGLAHDLRVTNQAVYGWLKGNLTLDTSGETGEPGENARAACPHFGASAPLYPLEAVSPAHSCRDAAAIEQGDGDVSQ